MSRPRITIAGLGPGGPEHVTLETLAAIERLTHRYVRTNRHPTAHLAGEALSFDSLYERADSFADVYAAIVEQLVAAAEQHGEVLYLVPGSPLVLERSVGALLADSRIDCHILPAMSFLDLVWARLAVDPIEAGVTLIDGHDFATAAADASGAVLVAHTHANWVLSEVKLSLDDPEGALDTMPAVLLHALGTPDERVVHTTWSEIDRTLEADHLTSLYIPQLTEGVGAGYVRFHRLARTLRERCPWDIEQTHRSLIPYLIEEAYEVVEAIEALDDEPRSPTADEALLEELGDLLYQIEFHATIAEQEGRFTIADVTQHVHDKLVRRHPHVFGDADGALVEVSGSGEVLSNWEAIKRVEKSRNSVFDGIPAALPALQLAHKVQGKAAKLGFDWPDVSGAIPKIIEEAQELAAAYDAAADGSELGDEVGNELGDLLFAVVNVARHLGADPESCLRVAIRKFQARVEGVEQLAATRRIEMHTADLATLDALWDEIKLGER